MIALLFLHLWLSSCDLHRINALPRASRTRRGKTVNVKCVFDKLETDFDLHVSQVVGVTNYEVGCWKFGFGKFDFGKFDLYVCQVSSRTLPATRPCTCSALIQALLVLFLLLLLLLLPLPLQTSPRHAASPSRQRLRARISSTISRTFGVRMCH